jgi:hypothetical protein
MCRGLTNRTSEGRETYERVELYCSGVRNGPRAACRVGGMVRPRAVAVLRLFALKLRLVHELSGATRKAYDDREPTASGQVMTADLTANAALCAVAQAT